MNKQLFRAAALLLMTALLFSCGGKEMLFTEKSGMVPYACQGVYAGKTVEIYYHIPPGDMRTMPVQIVMHGMDRDGDRYLDDWTALSDRYGFIVLVPQFSSTAFPEIAYQQGNVRDAAGNPLPKDAMVYPIISQVFHYFKDHSRSRAAGYNIYGHSAGGQFVHRYLLFNDTPEVEKAVAANSGWYTFPTDTIDYPYGTGTMETDIRTYYGKRLIILLGDADTLRSAGLRKTPEADAQGRNRLERGDAFFAFCRREAESLGVPFNWEKGYVTGAGHADAQMAPEAARLLYGL